LELARYHAVDHGSLNLTFSLYERLGRFPAPALNGVFDVRDDARPVLEVSVPDRVRRLQLGRLQPALGQPDRLGRTDADAVLVPRDLPRDRDRDLGVGARKHDHASLRLAEASRDALDRADCVAGVEQRRGLELSLLLVREAAENRLGHGRFDDRTAIRPEDAREAERAPPPGVTHGRPDRAALPNPAVVEGALLAQNADVDVLVHPVRSEPEREFADEQRALADRALLRLHRPHRPHGAANYRRMQGKSARGRVD